jgi:hypothetical protein
MKNLIPVFALFLILACNSTVENSKNGVDHKPFSARIDKPVKDIHLPAVEVTFNASEEKSFVTPKGSRVVIPPNAFVDQNGELVKGDVTIAFTEIHSAAEILISGIPMTVNSEDGERQDFESAGMFEIQGTANGFPIQIKEGKQLKIDLASPVQSEDYDFYAFSQQTNSWQLLYEKTPAQPNAVKREVQEQEELVEVPSRPIEIKKAGSNDLVFELAVDLVKNTEFKSLNSVLWRPSGKMKYDESIFESEIVNPDLTCIDQDRSIFQLEGVSRGDVISMQVEPVLFGSSFKKAQQQFQGQLLAYQQARQQIEEMKQAQEQMMKFQRSLTVSQFGLYNCDRYRRFSKQVKRRTISVVIPGLVAATSKIYLLVKNGVNRVNQGQSIVVPYYSQNSKYRITYDMTESNHLVLVDGKGTVYEHRNLNDTDLPGGIINGKATPVHFEKTEHKISDIRSLDTYLNELP